MEPGGAMPHSPGLSNNPYPEPNQPNSPHQVERVYSPGILTKVFYCQHWNIYFKKIKPNGVLFFISAHDFWMDTVHQN